MNHLFPKLYGYYPDGRAIFDKNYKPKEHYQVIFKDTKEIWDSKTKKFLKERYVEQD